jgi:hypothetical protein
LYAILGDPNAEDRKGSPVEIANHARIFYYAQRVGVMIDFNRYKEWLAHHPDHVPVDVLPDEFKPPTKGKDVSHEFIYVAKEGSRKENMDPIPSESAPATGSRRHLTDIAQLTTKMKDLSTEPAPQEQQHGEALDWQRAAPKADLYIDRKKRPQIDGAASGNSEEEPSYPLGFAQMLEMLQKGIRIPGIRDIPDTVVRDPVRIFLKCLKKIPDY